MTEAETTDAMTTYKHETARAEKEYTRVLRETGDYKKAYDAENTIVTKAQKEYEESSKKASTREPWQMTKSEYELVTKKRRNDVEAEILSVIEKDQRNYDEIALRSMNGRKLYKIGEELPESHVWEDNRKTKELLPGTSAIEIESYDDYGISEALDLASGYNLDTKTHQILVIGGNQVQGGEDEGEIILDSPKVLFVINNHNGLIVDPRIPTSNHKHAIEKALADGKPVPADVLKDYPDLVKTAKKAEPTISAVDASEVGAELSAYGHQKAKYKVTGRKSHTTGKRHSTSTGLGSTR